MADLARSAVNQRTVVFFDQAETADTGADSGANTGCILFRHFKGQNPAWPERQRQFHIE
ncbi:Uncharacterised protein [Klebsiella pneumoniae]|uniref:Uncharacterized protein n=1 Tax=Klebsiella pneumoniae TaxID=573 RepID=A0A2X1SGE8_KLEPN|nr:Uncharacterised protein [Klebsiella pneumoniae]